MRLDESGRHVHSHLCNKGSLIFLLHDVCCFMEVCVLSKREEYERRAEELLMPIIEENNYELVDVEYVKEAGTWYLRAYIDKEGGFTIGDCEKVSRFLSEELDRLDPIEQNYYLEVSSPGLDRELIKEKDFIRFCGRLVDISLYKAIDGKKTYQGILKGLTEDNSIVITDEKEEEIEFPREQVAKARLAVIF